MRFRMVPAGEPQADGTNYSVVDEDSGETFIAGKVTSFGSRCGLSRSSALLEYDRHDAEAKMRLWAHFDWPTVMAESNGRYISYEAIRDATVRVSVSI